MATKYTFTENVITRAYIRWEATEITDLFNLVVEYGTDPRILATYLPNRTPEQV